ncbi:MAG: hypothetical protein M1469_01485 [Bacteroidetes bacterium]|nr:hypothetical protein [Bacteroidota bacterium]
MTNRAVEGSPWRSDNVLVNRVVKSGKVAGKVGGKLPVFILGGSLRRNFFKIFCGTSEKESPMQSISGKKPTEQPPNHFRKEHQDP